MPDAFAGSAGTAGMTFAAAPAFGARNVERVTSYGPRAVPAVRRVNTNQPLQRTRRASRSLSFVCRSSARPAAERRSVMQQEPTRVRRRRWRPPWYWPVQMLATGIAVAPAALLLLQLGIAPDEFRHSPKGRVLAAAVSGVGVVLWLLSEIVAAFAREPKSPANPPAE